MKINHSWSANSHLSLIVGIVGAGLGLVLGVLVGIQPVLLCLAILSLVLVICFFAYFELTVLGLLILRSSLDIFSAQQIPAIFALGLNALTILYVALMLLTGRRIQTDRFWWFFVGWIGLQGLWLVLMLLGGLGLDASYLPISIREWVRVFSWLMTYLLILQLKGHVAPSKIIDALLLSLIVPLGAALLQTVLPSSMLPSFLSSYSAATWSDVAGASRINGTLGHPNTFSTFLVFFLGITYWKFDRSQRRLPWLILLSILAFFIVSTKALVGLAMASILIMAIVLSKVTPSKLISGILILVVLIGFFSSTEFGQERLTSITNTPLLNPDIDISQAILLSKLDGNSFNWRLAQWSNLLQVWRESPILGYGIGTAGYLGYIRAYAHNDYIRALVEGGIIGFLAFVGFLGSHCLRLIRSWLSSPPGSSRRSLCLVSLAIFLAIVVGMITENIWSHTTLFFYWSTLLAIIGWDFEQTPISNKSTRN